MTKFGAISGNKVVKLTIFCFEWTNKEKYLKSLSLKDFLSNILTSDHYLIHYQLNNIAIKLYQVYIDTKYRNGTTHRRKRPSHWKRKVVMMPTLSSLVASQVLSTTTCGASRDDKVDIITIVGFQWRMHRRAEIPCVNSLRPSDAIWRHKSGSTLAQVMACYLTAPSHYMNQCWLIISKV